MKKDKKYSLRNMIQSPIIKIIIGSMFCILIPILINKLLLDNFFQFLGLNENLNRAIRVFITILILMPFSYYYLFGNLENREITELRLKNNGKQIIINFILSIAIISISFILLISSGLIKASFLQFPTNIIVNLILIVSFVITEEIFFRGILYRIVENSWGTRIALISSVLVFALLHLGNANANIISLLSVATGGAVLGVIYTYTKNLLMPIAFHFGWNLTQVLLGFGLSGGNEFSNLYILKLNFSGSDILTGGTSGIENSIIAIFILMILFVVLYKKSSDLDKITFMKKRRNL